MPTAESTSLDLKGKNQDALASVQEHFRLFAHRAAGAAGSPWAFTAGVALVVLWAATGHWFDYSESWQLVINTGTTIVTFLMVFIIQNTQTRDSRELHVKLDELLRAVGEARTGVIRSDDLTDEELDRLHAELRDIAVRAEDAPEQRSAHERTARIVREWLKHPPKRRTAAHLAPFYRELQKHHPELVEFPEGTDPARELARILRGHLSA